MTAQDLMETPWSPMRDYPSVGFPHRHTVIASAELSNANGVRYDAEVITNRTRNRWWLCVLFQVSRTIRLYKTTTSASVRDQWTAAVNERKTT